jgi:hypothetical protein
MAIEPEMVEGVKRLLEEGYKASSVKDNLTKVGYSSAEADEIIRKASAGMAPLPAPKPAAPQKGGELLFGEPVAKKAEAKRVDVAPKPPPKKQEPEGEEMLFSSEESLLMDESGGGGSEDLSAFDEEAESVEKGPAVSKPKPPPRPAYVKPKEKPKPAPQPAAEEPAPPKRGGAMVFIILVVIVVLAAMFVTIALPKLGVKLI